VFHISIWGGLDLPLKNAFSKSSLIKAVLGKLSVVLMWFVLACQQVERKTIHRLQPRPCYKANWLNSIPRLISNSEDLSLERKTFFVFQFVGLGTLFGGCKTTKGIHDDGHASEKTVTTTDDSTNSHNYMIFSNRSFWKLYYLYFPQPEIHSIR